MKSQKKEAAPGKDAELAAAGVERALAATAIMYPDYAVRMAAERIAPEMFADAKVRAVMETVLDMAAHGRPVDMVTVGEEVAKTHGDGFLAFVEELSERASGVNAAHYEYHVRLLRGQYALRRTISLGMRLSGRALSGEEDIKTTTAEAMQELTEIIREESDAREKPTFEIRESVVRLWEDAAAGKRSALGLSWGFAGLDSITRGLYPGVTVLAARPSAGKTITEGIVSRFHLSQGRRVARVCLDMSEEGVVSRDICAIAGESMGKLRVGQVKNKDGALVSPVGEGGFRKVRAALELTRGWKEHVISDHTWQGILSRARALHATRGLDLLTIDYIQLIQSDAEGAWRENDNVRISRAVAAIKGFSLDTGVPVLLLSQLSRGSEQDQRLPELTDLRDSGSIEQDAACVVMLDRDAKVAGTTGKNGTPNGGWIERENVADWKSLKIRPIVAAVRKNQQDRTGNVCLRQYAAYFTEEEALPVSSAWNDDCNWGYDYSKPLNNPYVVFNIPPEEGFKGAFELVSARWYDALAAANERLGRPAWKEIVRVNGVEEGIETLRDVRKNVRAGLPPDQWIPEHIRGAAPPPPPDDEIPAIDD